MYGLTDLLGGARTVYLRRLTSQFADMRRRRIGFFAEAFMQDGDDAQGIRRYAPLQIGTRCDALVISPDKKRVEPTFFQCETRWNFSPTEFDLGSLSLQLSPFHWEKAKLTIHGEGERIAGAVATWFEAAFMPPMPRADQEIQDVVHDVDKFSSEAGITSCEVDFGTMPVAGLLALFDELRRAEATRVELSLVRG